jgi:hypothetical protein
MWAQSNTVALPSTVVTKYLSRLWTDSGNKLRFDYFVYYWWWLEILSSPKGGMLSLSFFFFVDKKKKRYYFIVFPYSFQFSTYLQWVRSTFRTLAMRKYQSIDYFFIQYLVLPRNKVLIFFYVAWKYHIIV